MLCDDYKGMLVISVLCFGIECGLGGAVCGGDLLRVPGFLVYYMIIVYDYIIDVKTLRDS